MPIPFHMTVWKKEGGSKDSPDTAECCTIAGRQNTALCQALQHEVYIPTNIQTGQPTGKRVHNKLTVTKVFDKSSPKLYDHLTRGTNVNVLFEFYRINDTGVEEKYFTIELEDATIVSIKPWIPNCFDKTTENYGHMEDVSFTYRKIVWTHHHEGGTIEGADDWMEDRSKA
jgi:type VI secretion system secreted protein Hcp